MAAFWRYHIHMDHRTGDRQGPRSALNTAADSISPSRAEQREMATNRRVILKEYVEGYPREEHMELFPGVEIPLRLSGDDPAGSVLVKNLYLSCDPYMRPKMSRPVRESYTAAFVPGSVITGYGVARVVDSSRPDLNPGDLVWGITAGRTTASSSRPCPSCSPRSPTTAATTACRCPTTRASSACRGSRRTSGSTRSARRRRARRCSCPRPPARWASWSASSRSSPGAASSAARGARRRSSSSRRASASTTPSTTRRSPTSTRRFPEGIDIYFENVGGAMLDAVLRNMRVHNKAEGEKDAVRSLDAVVVKRLRVQGFIEPDHKHLYPQYEAWVMPYIRDGTLAYVEGLESAPAALIGLFHGRNVGKQLVRVADE